MDYEIIETHILINNNELRLVAVLWKSDNQGGVRATYSTNKPCSGYEFLMPNSKISDMLLQKVAAAGMDLPADMKKVFFPGKRMWTH